MTRATLFAVLLLVAAASANNDTDTSCCLESVITQGSDLLVERVNEITCAIQDAVSILALIQESMGGGAKGGKGDGPYAASNCGNDNTLLYSDEYWVLDAVHGTWPADLFCRVQIPGSLGAVQYELQADMYNYNSVLGSDNGHFGFYYNAKDDYNYDFIYFRPHEGGGFVAGTIVDNEIRNDPSYSVPNPVQGKQWYTIKIQVVDDSANIFINDEIAYIGLSSGSDMLARGGLLAANGYRNVVFFKKLALIILEH